MKQADLNDKKLIWYGCLFIAFGVNSPKLLALREGGFVAQYFPFDLFEFLFQVSINFVFCFFAGKWLLKYWSAKTTKRLIYTIFFIAVLYLLLSVFGTAIQVRVFSNPLPRRVFFGGYLLRLGLSLILTFLLAKFAMVLKESRHHEIENEKLRSAKLKAELELLKEQLNPHFFFNALSSLSAIVRENPRLAQHYIKQLSTVFRYSIQKSEGHLVKLAEELKMIGSYAELLKMRFESGFLMDIEVDEDHKSFMLPHMSLQPLIENAVKHNMASVKNPLTIKIRVKNGFIVFSNNLQPLKYKSESNGIGLANLSERYRILMNSDIEIKANDNEFIIKLPLKKID
jgi:two-component system, LytTR family, sensor kinase